MLCRQPRIPQHAHAKPGIPGTVVGRDSSQKSSKKQLAKHGRTQFCCSSDTVLSEKPYLDDSIDQAFQIRPSLAVISKGFLPKPTLIQHLSLPPSRASLDT